MKRGDLLIEFDREGILGEGYDITTPVIVTNTGDYAQVNTQAAGSVKAGEPVPPVKINGVPDKRGRSSGHERSRTADDPQNQGGGSGGAGRVLKDPGV